MVKLHDNETQEYKVEYDTGYIGKVFYYYPDWYAQVYDSDGNLELSAKVDSFNKGVKHLEQAPNEINMQDTIATRAIKAITRIAFDLTPGQSKQEWPKLQQDLESYINDMLAQAHKQGPSVSGKAVSNALGELVELCFETTVEEHQLASPKSILDLTNAIYTYSNQAAQAKKL